MRITTLFIALTLNACVTINVERRSDIPIAAARVQSIGTQVRVEGIVTVASGAFDDGFALQDASGGIYVTRTVGDAMKPGSRVRVSAKIAAPNNQIAIEPATIELLGTGSVPTPVEIRTGAVSPSTEGRLLAVRGTVTGDVIDDQPWGWKIHLDDGSGRLLVFIATATNIDVKGFRAGQSLLVVGFSGRYEQHTELLPRQQADLEILSN
jgi:hypothetical protein